MRSYDAPTRQFHIRGKTRTLQALDVEKLLGIPHKAGKVVTSKVSEDDGTYVQMRKKYFQMSYTKLLNVIKSGKVDAAEMKMLFMLYSLGTLLCPTASVGVSERLIKVVAKTKGAVEEYDWATFVMLELSKEMGDYLTVFRKNEGRCNVGGCLYLLLIYLFEYFPIVQCEKHDHKDAITFWFAKRVKDMYDKERKGRMGLLYPGERPKVHTVKEENLSGTYLHPVLKQLHEKIVEMMEENNKKLIAAFDEELTKLQLQKWDEVEEDDQQDQDEAEEKNSQSDSGEEEENEHEDKEEDKDNDIEEGHDEVSDVEEEEVKSDSDREEEEEVKSDSDGEDEAEVKKDGDGEEEAEVKKDGDGEEAEVKKHGDGEADIDV